MQFCHCHLFLLFKMYHILWDHPTYYHLTFYIWFLCTIVVTFMCDIFLNNNPPPLIISTSAFKLLSLSFLFAYERKSTPSCFLKKVRSLASDLFVLCSHGCNHTITHDFSGHISCWRGSYLKHLLVLLRGCLQRSVPEVTKKHPNFFFQRKNEERLLHTYLKGVFR